MFKICLFRDVKCKDLLLSFVIIVNEESSDCLVEQKKQFEDVTLGSITFFYFFIFHKAKMCDKIALVLSRSTAAML